jgi:hypothetical protein
MGIRLNPEYVQDRFNPTWCGWAETSDEVQVRDEFTADDLAGLRIIPGTKLHTWTRDDKTITLVARTDWYIVTAVINGLVSDEDAWINTALDLLEAPDTTGDTAPTVKQPDHKPRGYSDVHLEEVARAFRNDNVTPSSTSGPAYIAVMTWTSTSGCTPVIAAADDPNLLLVRLVQVLAADMKAGHLAEHVDEVFLATHPVPELPDDVDELSPAVFEADQWLTALGESSSDPDITFHATSVATRDGALDAEWGLTRHEIKTLIQLACVAGKEFEAIGTGTDYDAFDLALATFHSRRDEVVDLVGRAYSRVVDRSDVA